jgi:3-hydroxyacyl-CoA dehydrogenase
VLARASDEWTVGANLRALVLCCKGSTYFSGAEIGKFSGSPKEDEYRELYGHLERLPMLIVVAMSGAVLGGGPEIALGCRARREAKLLSRVVAKQPGREHNVEV